MTQIETDLRNAAKKRTTDICYLWPKMVRKTQVVKTLILPLQNPNCLSYYAKGFNTEIQAHLPGKKPTEDQEKCVPGMLDRSRSILPIWNGRKTKTEL